MVSHNDIHRGIINNQLGKAIHHRTPEDLAFLADMLYNINMGYVVPEKITPHSSVRYYKEEQKFYHPWSIEEIGRSYEFGRIKDFMTLNDYLTLPAHLVDGLLKGMYQGKMECDAEMKRIKKQAEEQAAREGKRPQSEGVMTPEEMELARHGLAL